MNFKIAGTAILCATALTACQTGGSYYRPLPAQPRVQTIEGTWADSNGLISTFQGGSFATRTTDTNQLLASGTYAQINDKLIEIKDAEARNRYHGGRASKEVNELRAKIAERIAGLTDASEQRVEDRQ